MTYLNKLAIVVPTRNRPDDLRRLLKSLATQSVPCDQFIIVDGSDEPIEYVLKEFPQVALDYVRVYPPSLSRQRNAGMQRIRSEITIAGYLDDDIVLLEGTLEAMLSFWQTASSEIGGARFNIVDEPLSRATWLQSLFLMRSRQKGAILKSGYNTFIGPSSHDKYVQWLSGGVTIWRREVVSEFEYDEWFQGHGHLEDVDYSYRVAKKYKLAVIADARVLHLSYPISKDKNYLFGQWQVINRIYFVKKHPELSVLLCYWALFGQLLTNLTWGVIQPNTGRLQRAFGNMVGLTKVLTGRIERIGGFCK